MIFENCEQRKIYHKQYRNCKQCGHELECWSIGWHCSNCGCFEDMNGNVHKYKETVFAIPKTNADKIRNMTDEELADFIQRVQIGDFSNLDYGKTFCDMCNDKYQCEDCLKLWLKQHVEGE